MSRIFPDDELTERINSCTNSAALAELLHQKGVKDGVLRRTEEGMFVPKVSDPRVQAAQTYQKTVFVNGFALELTASSPEKLAALEEIARGKR